MKKFLISLILGISASALISCSNNEVNQDNIPNKYPINEFTEKGATLQEYKKTGSAIMTDTKSQNFFASFNSTYKVLLTSDGVLMPLIVVNNTPYYYDFKETKNELPENYKKTGISFFSGNSEELIGEKDSYKFTQLVTAYINKEDKSSIYLKIKDKDEYQLWKSYDSLAK
ncbi:hypothetical protein H8S20_12560 [Clostridium sp. NSJ-6]|uniref:Lipoprotein n=1 Tax=Clostridium hominis TaxID=2763036 RepID=A0ABR7DFV6_9CLOT|nr:hypothetical protein [Clostridium hominis]MBC5629718.1 hypothetical protein [Clostridium hominis]